LYLKCQESLTQKISERHLKMISHTMRRFAGDLQKKVVRTKVVRCMLVTEETCHGEGDHSSRISRKCRARDRCRNQLAVAHRHRWRRDGKERSSRTRSGTHRPEGIDSCVRMRQPLPDVQG